MTTSCTALPPPVNHVFVDYENVREIDPTIIGRKTYHITVLLGAHKTKFEGTVVEQLVQHASIVEFIRLESSGRNALDFALTYYLGRAVLANPTGYFHIVSKDKGYDPLVEHLCNKHVHVSRHDDFSSLASSSATKPIALSPPTKSATKASTAPRAEAKTKPVPKPEPKPKVWSLAIQERGNRMLERLRTPTARPPRTKARLLSYLIARLGQKVTDAHAGDLIEYLTQAGHLTIDDKGKVTYHFPPA